MHIHIHTHFFSYFGKYSLRDATLTFLPLAIEKLREHFSWALSQREWVSAEATRTDVCFRGSVVYPEGLYLTDRLGLAEEERVLGRRVGWHPSKSWRQLYIFLLFREDDLPPKCSSSAKAFHTEISSSENNTLTSSNTYNSRYWSNNPKVPRNTESFNHFSDLRQSFSLHSGNANIPSIYANGSHLVPAPHKTLVVTANRGSPPQVMSRSNGSVSRKPRPQHTHSYTVSQATLERIGAVPVMVPAQSRAGSLV